MKMQFFFLSSLNMCFVCSKEPSHWDGSFEYPEPMFWLRNKEIIFSYAVLSGGLYVFRASKSVFNALLAQVSVICW